MIPPTPSQAKPEPAAPEPAAPEPAAPEPAAPDPPQEGAAHLKRITRFQGLLTILGAAAWGLRSWQAILVFLAGSLASVAYWQLHRVLVVRMLSPQLRRRWFCGILTLVKLALIAGVLRGMMSYFPLEVLPLVTGLLLFIGSIMLEAAWLVFRPEV